MYGYPEPRTQDGNATAVKADPRREVIENVILKNGCASTGDWTPVFRFPVGCSNHWAIDTTYSEAVWIAVIYLSIRITSFRLGVVWGTDQINDS